MKSQNQKLNSSPLHRGIGRSQPDSEGLLLKKQPKVVLGTTGNPQQSGDEHVCASVV